MIRDKNPVDVQIARRIQRARLQAGMSETDLAKAIGVTPVALRGLEAGEPAAAATLYAIAEVLDRDLGFFYEGVWVFPSYGE